MAKNTKRYAIVHKKNIVPLFNDTKYGRYMIRPANYDGFDWEPSYLTVRRRASTREEARAIKKAMSNPRNWAIVDMHNGYAVR